MYAEAIEQYEHALKLKPEHKGFKRTLESLKKQMNYEQTALSYSSRDRNGKCQECSREPFVVLRGNVTH
jgi:hypothetical protein